MIPIWSRFSLRPMYVEVVLELTSKQSGVKCSEHTTELLVGVHFPLLRCTKVTQFFLLLFATDEASLK